MPAQDKKVSKIYVVHRKTVLVLIEDKSGFTLCYFGADGKLLKKITFEEC